MDGRELAGFFPSRGACQPDRVPVPGTVPLSGSIRENIAFGVEHTGRRRRVSEALKIANLEEDLKTFPAGAETQIGELGVRISVGSASASGWRGSLSHPRSHRGFSCWMTLSQLLIWIPRPGWSPPWPGIRSQCTRRPAGDHTTKLTQTGSLPPGRPGPVLDKERSSSGEPTGVIDGCRRVVRGA